MKGMKTGGRRPGSVNKATKEFRETVRALLDANSENVSKWLKLVAEGEDDVKPDPGKALALLAQLAEFAAPKLARTEVAGDPDNPLKTSIEVTFK